MFLSHLRRSAIVVAVALGLIAGLLTLRSSATVSSSASPSTSDTSVPDLEPVREQPGDFAIVVDEALTPATASVPGFHDGDAERSVARLQTGAGAMDVVVGELLVSTRTDEELDAFLDRWSGVVVDTMPFDPGDEYRDHLVRIDPSSADVANAAANLVAVEDHDGTMQVGDDALQQLLAALAEEASTHGTIVAFNTVESGFDIVDGEVFEHDDINKNVFDWTYMRGGDVQDFAVAPAWQLLAAHGKLTPSVDILINDGGFNANPDFPDNITLRHADWGDKNPTTCSGGASCPWHGTMVLMTAAAVVDNDYGVAGTGGPVVDHVIAVQIHKERYKRLRKLEDRVDQYRPAVVNMSYGGTITAARAATEWIMNRRYERMRNWGTLLVAAAGNDGFDLDQTKCVGGNCFERRLVLPCESIHVLCVGGLDTNSNTRASGSNFGAEDDGRSVELWGPMRVATIADPDLAYTNPSTQTRSGTSFASPFVAGVAALVKAADPSLGPDEIRSILNDTANTGVSDQWITGSQRRVDALAAVAAALGVDVDGPAVEITYPTHGKDYSVSNWLQLQGTATDFQGEPLPISWESSLDGFLGESTGVVSLDALTIGTHVLTATAEDGAHQVGTDTITFEVIRRPHEVTLSSPPSGATYQEGDPIALASGTQDPEDFWQPLPDAAVEWTVTRSNGSVAWSGTGHDHVLPGTALAPGSYTVEVAATANGTTVTEERSITVTALPPGHTKPVPTIHAPTDGAVFYADGDTIQLSGSAVDAEDGNLSGTRFRWVARAGDEEVVLCTGSRFHPGSGVAPSPGSSGGLGLAGRAETSCATAEVELDVSPLAPGDYGWRLYLEVRDHAGDPGVALVEVEVLPVIG